MAMTEQEKKRVKEKFNNIVVNKNRLDDADNEWHPGNAVASGLFSFDNYEPGNLTLPCDFWSDVSLKDVSRNKKPIIGPWLENKLKGLVYGCSSLQVEKILNENKGETRGKKDAKEAKVASLTFGEKLDTDERLDQILRCLVE